MKLGGLFVWSLLTAAVYGQAVNVILDSDLGNDCEDAGAIAILNALADRGEARILAMIYPMRDPWGAPAMDAINTYYGRPGLPIGTYRGSFVYTQPNNDKPGSLLAHSFPNRLQHGDNAYDAIALYRKTLAAQPDHSVVIIVIGPLQTLHELLASGADRYSPLSGRDLVAKKVERLSVMGGAFPKSADVMPNFTSNKYRAEWNFLMAPEAAADVTRRWPTSINFSGFEIGHALVAGQRLFTETPLSNPVRRAYENDPSCTSGRFAWDETAVLYGVRGARDYWFVEKDGHVQVDPSDGSNEWHASPDHKHSYLKLRKPSEEMVKIIGDLQVQPPQHRPAEAANSTPH